MYSEQPPLNVRPPDHMRLLCGPAHVSVVCRWTGDAVGLSTTVNDMVASSIGTFKPYVHSDCGGNAATNAATGGGDVIRWTVRWLSHCPRFEL